jgi:hypothetical protein
MSFPYGLLHHTLYDYINFVKFNKNTKNIKILNQHSGAHAHLPDNHIRKMYSIFGIDSGNPLSFPEYLKNISNANFVISTEGDRCDCYRHYECIGLDAIPVSNITQNGYIDIFEQNMIFSNAEEMINMVINNNVHNNYIPPNKDILTVSFWKNKIKNRIHELKISSHPPPVIHPKIQPLKFKLHFL